MSTTPWLSILIPTYNGSAFLEAALSSLVQQTNKNFEVILIDDGSTDDTLAIAARYQTQIPLHIHANEHQGSWTANSNTGLALANGLFACILHQDDYWYPEKVATLEQAWHDFPEARFLVHPVHFVSETGTLLGEWNCALPATDALLHYADIADTLAIQNFISVSGVCFRIDTAKQLGGFQKELWYIGDWDLWLKFARAGNWLHIKQHLSVFRIHAAAQTVTGGKTLAAYQEQTGAIIDMLPSFLEEVSQTPRETLQLAKISNEINLTLFAVFNGWLEGTGNFLRLIKLLLTTNPLLLPKYFYASRIVERLGARIRGQLPTSGQAVEEPLSAGESQSFYERVVRSLFGTSLFIALLFSGAAFFSGPLRTISGMNLSLATLLSALLLAAPLARISRRLARSRFQWLPLSLLITIAGGGFFFAQMYSPLYDGLVSTGGGDAADHIYYRYKFTHSDPGMYHGFVTFFSFTHWLERAFSFSAFESFRFAFYFVGVAIFLTLGVLAQYLLTRTHGMTPSYRKQAFYFLILVLVAALPLDYLLFPTLSYLQADGFYPQLFGLLPLLLGLSLYVCNSSAMVRILSLGSSLLLYRYTYGLNLADVLLCYAALLAFEIPARYRRLRLFICSAGILVSGYLLGLLVPLVARGGAILHTSIPHILSGTLLLSLLCVVIPTLIPLSDAGKRLGRFSGILGFATCLPVSLWLLSGIPVDYYLYKYPFHSTLVLVIATILIATAAILQYLHMRLNRKALARPSFLTPCIAGLLATAGLLFLKSGYEITRPHYEERKRASLPSELLEPLVDQDAQAFIASVLEATRMEFGGFVTTPYWALSGFSNAEFSYYHYGMPRLHRTGKLEDSPGHCIFWNSNPEDFKLFKERATQKVYAYLKQQEADSQTRSQLYQVPWKHEANRISYHCYQ